MQNWKVDPRSYSYSSSFSFFWLLLPFIITEIEEEPQISKRKNYRKQSSEDLEFIFKFLMHYFHLLAVC